jgi:uncharacterized protein (DUF608 family)
MMRNTTQSILQAASLALVFVYAPAARPAAAELVTGAVLDFPLPYPDGSIRFHILPPGRPERPARLSVSADTATQAKTVRFADRFEGPRDTRWVDVSGSTEVRDGALRSTSDGSVTILNGLVDQQAKVRLMARKQLQFGIVLRYENNDNYVLAFFEPTQKIIAVHERKNGSFGSHVTATKIEGLTAGPITLETEIAGADLKLVLSDSQGGTWKAACKLSTLVQPGSLGIYCDQAGSKGAQEFNEFEAEVSLVSETVLDPARSGFVALPVGSVTRPLVLFQENFDGQNPRALEAVVGATQEADGQLRLRGAQVVALANGVQQQDATVSVNGDADLQFGVVLRYHDADNYLMAFYSPAQKAMGWHERRNGNFGNWVTWRAVPEFKSKRARLTAVVEGSRIRSLLTDDEGNAFVCAGKVEHLRDAGRVGVYFDTAAKAGEQRVDDFVVIGRGAVVRDDAVQVVVPAKVRGDSFVWNLGERVRVKGEPTASLCGGEKLKAIEVKTAADLTSSERQPDRLFPTRAPSRDWVRFPSPGFKQPVTGVVYRLADPVVCGVALGGLDTGCLDLETSGLWGYSTLFNSHLPRSGPHNEPALGLSVGGRTWVLCNPRGTKSHFVSSLMANPLPGDDPRRIAPGPLEIKGVSLPKEIHYFGHYPVADMEFETDAPVSVGMRAWSPFLPGDEVGSMMPALFMEVHLRNESSQRQRGAVAVNFPGPVPAEADSIAFQREQRVEGDLRGVQVAGRRAAFVLGAANEATVRTGGGLGADGAAWSQIHRALPVVGANQSSASAAVDFDLAAGEHKVVRFVASWYSPQWYGGGSWGFTKEPKDGVWGQPINQLGTYTHMYAKHWPDAWQTARAAAQGYAALQQRVLGWQAEVYNDLTLPSWLREGLVNVLYLITETGLWAQKDAGFKPEFKAEDGLYGMCESPRACPQIECIPCSFYGNIPLVYFFPKAALSTLRGYKNYQDAEGAPPWIFGPAEDFRSPGRGYQLTMNPACYTEMVSRYWKTHGDAEFLKEFYPSVKKTTEFTMSMNRGPGGIIAMPDHRVSAVSVGGGSSPETEWFEFLQWYGYATHPGAVKLAHLRTVAAMARSAGDPEFAEKCDRLTAEGMQVMEDKLWVKDGGYYRNFIEESTGRKSDHIFAYQLDGEWMARFNGVPGVFPKDRVSAVLRTVREKNVPHTRYGAVNLVNPDGTIMAYGGFPLAGFYEPYDFFTPELYMLSMTYIYAGEKDFGLELGRRCQQNIALEQGMTWDGANVVRGNTGERGFGNDYYQNMMMWSYPAALAGGDITGPMKDGGLVERVIQAAKAK